MHHELWGLPVWLGCTGTTPGPVWAPVTHLPNSLRLFLPSFRESPLVHVVVSTQPNTQRGPSYRSVKFSFSVPLSSLVRCSGNSTHFVLPCLLHLGNPFVSTWVPLWVLWPGNPGAWDNCKAYRGPLPLDVLCPVFWKLIGSYVSPIFVCFWREGQLHPYYSILAGSRGPSCPLKI